MKTIFAIIISSICSFSITVFLLKCFEEGMFDTNMWFTFLISLGFLTLSLKEKEKEQ